MSELLNFTDPYTGEVVQFKESRKKDAVKAGYLPSTLSEVIEHKKEETYGGTIGTIGTGVLSGLSGGTFGLSDYALTRGGVILPEELRDLRTINPNADMAGNLIGGATSMVFGGAPLSLLAKGSAKVGAKVAAKTARALGKSGTTAIPRLAGGLAREGTLGAGIGLGGGISDIAVSPELETSQAVGHLFSSTAKGAGFGAGLGALAFTGKAGLNKAVGRFSRGTTKLKTLQSEKEVLLKEADVLKKSGAPAPKIEALNLQLEGVEVSIKQQQAEVLKTMFHRAVGAGIGSVFGGGIGGATLGYLAAPKALSLIGKMVTPIGKKVDNVAKRIVDRVAPHFQKADDYLKKAMDNKAISGALGGIVEQYGGKAADAVKRAATATAQKVKLSDSATQIAVEAAGHAVGKATGYLAQVAPEKAIQGFGVGGVEGMFMGLATHMAEKEGKEFFLGRLTNAMTNKVIPSGKVAIISALNDSEIIEAVENTKGIEKDHITLSIMADAPQAPPELVGAISDKVVNAVNYAQSQLPPKGNKSQTQRKQQARKIRAITDPESFLRDFSQGRLSSGQVAAWKAVYPEALEQLRSVVRAEMAKSEAEGGKYTKKQKSQIGLLLADKKMYDPKAVAMMQEMHRANTESKIKSKRGRVNLSGEHQTTTQRIRGN